MASKRPTSTVSVRPYGRGIVSCAPVMVMEEGRRVIKPMHYQCRPAGKPAFYDTKFPGTYNARRDSLGGFWKESFGFRDAILVVKAFYENVSRHRMERRELRPGERDENVVLEFRPNPPEQMLVACLEDESLSSAPPWTRVALVPRPE